MPLCYLQVLTCRLQLATRLNNNRKGVMWEVGAVCPTCYLKIGMLTAACHQAQLQQEGCAVGRGCMFVPLLSPSAGMLNAACHQAQVQQEGCIVGGVPPLLSPSADLLTAACNQAQLQLEVCAVGGGAVCPPYYLQVLAC